MVILLCFFLPVISFLTFLIASRVCSGPMGDSKTIPHRRRYFIAPGLLILVCIWVFWGTFFPWMNRAYRRASKVVCMARMKGLGTALVLYSQEYHGIPDRLGRLVDTGYASPSTFSIYGASRTIRSSEIQEDQSFIIPKEFHYIHLPDNAPKNLIWVWFDPTLYEGEPIPVLYKSGAVERISPGALCNELAKTYTWLLEHRGKAETAPGK